MAPTLHSTSTRPAPPTTEAIGPGIGEPQQVFVRKFVLRVLDGPDAGAVHAASGERTVIGTHSSATVQLADPTLSRFHCEIVTSEGAAVIRDLGSRNGTLVNSVRVREAELHDGAVLTLGRTQLAFEAADERLGIELAGREEFGEMVGRSPAMRAVFAVLGRAARGDMTVLLQGETGTGKDVAARSLHRESARRAGPFVVVDCGAIPGQLLESELFGHERGAFTGADRARPGALELASGGTLFLDEIGELALELQPKLLRVLETRQVRRVGGSESTPVDVRIIAATNRNLRVEVNARRFRADLFYRLAVVEVTLPALREHPADLPLLVEQHLAAARATTGPAAQLLRSRKLLLELARHAWPGNVRELRNYLDRCLTLGADVPLAPARELPDPVPSVDITRPLAAVRERWVRNLERRYLEDLLRACGGNATATARAAGVDRKHLYRLLWRSGLR